MFDRRDDGGKGLLQVLFFFIEVLIFSYLLLYLEVCSSLCYNLYELRAVPPNTE